MVQNPGLRARLGSVGVCFLPLFFSLVKTIQSISKLYGELDDHAKRRTLIAHEIQYYRTRGSQSFLNFCWHVVVTMRGLHYPQLLHLE